MKLTGLATLGRDAEFKPSDQGGFCNLSLAYNHGKKDESGKRPTQWVDGMFFGKRAETLAPYLKKGTQIVVTLDDPNVVVKEGKAYLKARVNDVELVRGQNGGSAPAAATPKPAAASSAQQRAPAGQRSDSMRDFEDDDIPF